MDLPCKCLICSKIFPRYYGTCLIDGIFKEYMCGSCIQANHSIYYYCIEDIQLISLAVVPVRNIYIKWDIKNKKMYLSSYKKNFESLKSDIELPYVKPDFSKYQKLIKKLQCYIVLQ